MLFYILRLFFDVNLGHGIVRLVALSFYYRGQFSWVGCTVDSSTALGLGLGLRLASSSALGLALAVALAFALDFLLFAFALAADVAVT